MITRELEAHMARQDELAECASLASDAEEEDDDDDEYIPVTESVTVAASCEAEPRDIKIGQFDGGSDEIIADVMSPCPIGETVIGRGLDSAGDEPVEQAADIMTLTNSEQWKR